MTSTDRGHLIALASLPGMGPRRLAALLGSTTPAGAWAVAAGRAPAPADVVEAVGARWRPVADGWRLAARALEPAALAEAHEAAGVGVWAGTSLPSPLADDVEPPGVLFHRGEPAHLDGARVAVVGTRRATRYGLEVAFELGRDLAAAGVRVVSGLASGIDGAAHQGALAAGAAPPVGVVGSGLDVVYPPSHRTLWEAVASRGLLLSEHPLGTRPARWHFPARNRLLAALADVVVVVESGERGGSLTTVDEALRRDVPVQAVPGSVRSRASVGTNALLADGAAPCRGAPDVLDALGLAAAAPGARRADAGPALTPDLLGLLDAIGWEPTGFDALALRTGRTAADLAAALARLEAAGLVSTAGGWIERRAP